MQWCPDRIFGHHTYSRATSSHNSLATMTSLSAFCGVGPWAEQYRRSGMSAIQHSSAADRVFLATASRLLPRNRWCCFRVRPETLLR